MQFRSRTLLCCLALAACGDDANGPTAGDDADGPTACEVGPDILGAATSAVEQNQPLCTRDEDCVIVNLGVKCAGFSASSCSDIVHRASAALWDAAQVCDDIRRASVPSSTGCSVDGVCAGPSGAPVCRSGRCTGADEP
jgi:hypothetical protein